LAESKKQDRALLALGIVITFPMILASGPIAGYAIGRFILVTYFEMPAVTVPILVGLGFVASALQGFRLIKKIRSFDSK